MRFETLNGSAAFPYLPQYRAKYPGRYEGQWQRVLGDLGRSRAFLMSWQSAPRSSHPALVGGLIPARQQIEDRFTVPVGSILYGFTGSSTDSCGQVNDGYRFNVQTSDQRRLCVTDARIDNLTGQPEGIDEETFDPAVFFLVDPWVVTGDGLLTVKMTNLSTSASRAQLVAWFGLRLEGCR